MTKNEFLKRQREILWRPFEKKKVEKLQEATKGVDTVIAEKVTVINAATGEVGKTAEAINEVKNKISVKADIILKAAPLVEKLGPDHVESITALTEAGKAEADLLGLDQELQGALEDHQRAQEELQKSQEDLQKMQEEKSGISVSLTPADYVAILLDLAVNVFGISKWWVSGAAVVVLVLYYFKESIIGLF